MGASAWNDGPAFAVVLAQLAELYTRALRVDEARRLKNMAALSRLIEKRTTP